MVSTSKCFVAVNTSALLHGRTLYFYFTINKGSNLKVYVNGIEDGKGTSAGYAGVLSKPFVIGKASWYDGSFFSGIIDEAGLFNKALTEGEIRGIMNSGLQGRAAVFSKGKLATAWATIKAH